MRLNDSAPGRIPNYRGLGNLFAAMDDTIIFPIVPVFCLAIFFSNLSKAEVGQCDLSSLTCNA